MTASFANVKVPLDIDDDQRFMGSRIWALRFSKSRPSDRHVQHDLTTAAVDQVSA